MKTENVHYDIAENLDTFTIIKNSLTDEQMVGAMLFNIIKYGLRAGDKVENDEDILKDIKKKLHYKRILKNYYRTGNWELDC